MWAKANPDIQTRMDAVDVVIKTMTQDAASVNECITCHEKEKRKSCLGDAAAASRYRAVWSLACLSHQPSLAARCVYANEGDYASFLVRLAHVLQNSITWATFLDRLDKVVDSIYEHRVVTELPPEVEQWQRDARWILEASMGASQDITPSLVEEVLRHANSDWSGGKYIHYHLVSRCLCESAEDGRRIAE